MTPAAGWTEHDYYRASRAARKAWQATSQQLEIVGLDETGGYEGRERSYAHPGLVEPAGNGDHRRLPPRRARLSQQRPRPQHISSAARSGAEGSLTMFPVEVRMDEEHVESLEMALAALEAERKTCERWGPVTTRHALAIDDMHELIDRARRASKLQGAKDPVGTVIQLMRTGRPW